MAIGGIFSNPIFGAPKGGQKAQAAIGFTQVFAGIVAQQLRQALVGEDQGPMGIGGGAGGDIYGTLLDQALGHQLAASPALKSLNQAIERELGSPGSRQARPRAETRVADPAAGANQILLQNGTDAALSSDARGPLLLPPAPARVASVLPPPPSLEG